MDAPVAERKYVFIRFKAENDRSLTVFVAGIKSGSFPREDRLLTKQTSLRGQFRGSISGVVIGAFRSILVVSILLLNMKIL